VSNQPDDLRGQMEHDTELEALRKANRKLSRKLAEANKGNVEYVSAVYEAARDASVIVGAPLAPTPPPAPRTRKSRPVEVALLHSTDWQIGKRTSTYSIATAKRRMAEMSAKTIQLADIQAQDHRVDDCVLMLGGDMVEGVNIFPGQAWEIEVSLYEQLFEAGYIAKQQILDLLTRFKHVHVVCEYGNHGRTGKRHDGLPAEDNFDLIMYRQIAEWFESHKKFAGRVTFQYGPQFYQLVDIGAYQALLVHGDEVFGFGQTPMFAISKKCNAWSSGPSSDRRVIPGTWTDVYMGHFHQAITIPLAHGNGRVFVSPSPESSNTYAQKDLAASGMPGQRLNFVNPERGMVTAEYMIWMA
jgi:hypothetical protein